MPRARSLLLPAGRRHGQKGAQLSAQRWPPDHDGDRRLGVRVGRSHEVLLRRVRGSKFLEVARPIGIDVESSPVTRSATSPGGGTPRDELRAFGAAPKRENHASRTRKAVSARLSRLVSSQDSGRGRCPASA